MLSGLTSHIPQIVITESASTGVVPVQVFQLILQAK